MEGGSDTHPGFKSDFATHFFNEPLLILRPSPEPFFARYESACANF